jgi:hypothetical protein
VAEGARLESVYTGNRIVGSNPTPSASLSYNSLKKHGFLLLMPVYRTFYLRQDDALRRAYFGLK